MTQINPIAVIKKGERWIAHFGWSFETKEFVKRAGWTFSPTEKLWYTRNPLIAAKIGAAPIKSSTMRTPREPNYQYLPGTASAVLDKAEERRPTECYLRIPDDDLPF